MYYEKLKQEDQERENLRVAGMLFQARFDARTQEVLRYWREEYGIVPDAWELAQELEISEEVAQKQLERFKSPTLHKETHQDQ